MNFEPNLLWSIAALVAAAQAVFVAAVLCSKKENRVANRLLAGLLLPLAGTLVEWSLWWSGNIEFFPILKGATFGFPLLFGPLLFLFYKNTFERKALVFKDIWHFTPFFATVFLMLPFYLRHFGNAASGLAWIPPLTREAWFPYLIFGQMIGYAAWIGGRFRAHFLEKKELRRWHRWLLASFAGIVSVYIFYRLLPAMGLTDASWKHLVATSLMFFIYLVAWLGYIEPRVFAGEPLARAANPLKYRKSALSERRAAEIFEKAKNLVETENVFRDPNFSLDQLAKRLGEQRHHVSQAINSVGGGSFSSFLAEQRIRAAQNLLAETNKQEKNVIEIAYEVGFSNKEAFNLAFKKITGMTPSAFRQLKKTGV